MQATRVLNSTPQDDQPGLDVNAIVASNIRVIRRERGMTQAQVAERLAPLTGRRVTQAAISAMERDPGPGGRGRQFNAHELYLLSTVLDVPMTYLFLPAPDMAGKALAGTNEPATDLWRSVLGTDDQVAGVDDRIDAFVHQSPDSGREILAATVAPKGRSRGLDERRFKRWREQRLEKITAAEGDRFAQVADLLDECGAMLRDLGPTSYLRSLSCNPEPPESAGPSARGDTAPQAGHVSEMSTPA